MCRHQILDLQKTPLFRYCILIYLNVNLVHFQHQLLYIEFYSMHSLVNEIPFDEIIFKNCICPYSKLNIALWFYSITYRNYHLKIILLNRPFYQSSTLSWTVENFATSGTSFNSSCRTLSICLPVFFTFLPKRLANSCLLSQTYLLIPLHQYGYLIDIGDIL